MDQELNELREEAEALRTLLKDKEREIKERLAYVIIRSPRKTCNWCSGENCTGVNCPWSPYGIGMIGNTD